MRTRRRKDEIDPRRQRHVRVANADADRLAHLDDFARADCPVQLARLQDLADFAVEDGANVLGARAAERGQVSGDFRRLEKDSVHALLPGVCPRPWGLSPQAVARAPRRARKKSWRIAFDSASQTPVTSCG